MNLPQNKNWYQKEPYNGWVPSHGLPQTDIDFIGLESRSNYGEGINLLYDFTQNQNYCMQTILSFDQMEKATGNIVLTQNFVQNQNLFFRNIPETPTPYQTILQQQLDNIQKGPQTYAINFKAQQNFNNIWFYSKNPQKQAIQMIIQGIRICMVDLCDQVQVNIEVQQKCSLVKFKYNIDTQGGSIIGQTWNFGDGKISNESTTIHDYNKNGRFSVQLNVYLKIDEKCCNKTFNYVVDTQKCNPCQQIGVAGVV